MGIKRWLVFVIFLVLIVSSYDTEAARGVSERSVKKWDFVKLCERHVRYKHEEDWKAVAINEHHVTAPQISMNINNYSTCWAEDL